MAAVGGAAAAAVPADSKAANPALARVTHPTKRLANLRDLKVDVPVAITSPDDDSPGVLLKLGRRVEGGVGPDGDVVAFSTLCPHTGYPLFFRAADKTLTCPGHDSRFDCAKGGRRIMGQSAQNLPQFTLRVGPNGDIVAEGVEELIHGRLSNVL